MPFFGRFGWVIMVLGWAALGNPLGVQAGSLREARLTRVIKNVRIDGPNAQSRPASVNAILPDGKASLSTGADSRAEITYRDRTVVRLGDKTGLGLLPRDRTFVLAAGAMLAQVPAHVGGTSLKVANITAAVTGTTLLLEYHPKAYVKFIVLDGTVRLCLKNPGHPGDCVLLRSGQMLIASPAATGLPDAVDVDLDRLVKTCQLISDFPTLPGQDLLAAAVARQRALKSDGAYADTKLVIFGRGTLVNVTSSKKSGTGSQPAASSPNPSVAARSTVSP